MIVIAAAIIGAFLGWRRAGKLGGTWRDRAQYAAGFGIAFGGGNGNRDCNTRANAAMIQALAGDEAALDYVCYRDDELRAILQARGKCQSIRSKAQAASAPATRTRLVCPASHPVMAPNGLCARR